MILEWKIFLHQFTQKQLLLRASTLLFLVYLMTRQPRYPEQVISMLICYAASFGSLEYMVNVFGLDGWAFYLHYLSTSSLPLRLIRRVSVGFTIQLILGVLLSALFYFQTDAANFRYHGLILSIVLLQNASAGCLFSAAFPRAIPKTLEKKVFRVHPGLGLSIAGALTIIVPTVFYLALRMTAPDAVLFYSKLYLLLLLLFLPVSAVWAARTLRRGVFPKLQALTTEP